MICVTATGNFLLFFKETSLTDCCCFEHGLVVEFCVDCFDALFVEMPTAGVDVAPNPAEEGAIGTLCTFPPSLAIFTILFDGTVGVTKVFAVGSGALMEAPVSE